MNSHFPLFFTVKQTVEEESSVKNDFIQLTAKAGSAESQNKEITHSNF